MEQTNNNNFYGPPQARVADLDSEQATTRTRPRQVVVAIWLMWIATIVPYVIRRIYMSLAYFQNNENNRLMLFGFAFAVVFQLLITLGLVKGKNWVRITHLILSILGVIGLARALSLEGIVEKFYHGSLFLITMAVLQQLILAASLIFLFTKPGTDWFRRRNNQ